MPCTHNPQTTHRVKLPQVVEEDAALPVVMLSIKCQDVAAKQQQPLTHSHSTMERPGPRSAAWQQVWGCPSPIVDLDQEE